MNILELIQQSLKQQLNGVRSTTTKLSRYTEKTANAYRIALDNAERYLASLFDDDGTPTAENVKTNQSKADGYADALDEATAELAPTLDRYGDVSLALDAIPALCKLADKAIGNTALNGCDTLKTKRDAAYAVWQKYAETQLNLNASEYREIRTAYPRTVRCLLSRPGEHGGEHHRERPRHGHCQPE